MESTGSIRTIIVLDAQSLGAISERTESDGRSHRVSTRHLQPNFINSSRLPGGYGCFDMRGGSSCTYHGSRNMLSAPKSVTYQRRAALGQTGLGQDRCSRKVAHTGKLDPEHQSRVSGFPDRILTDILVAHVALFAENNSRTSCLPFGTYVELIHRQVSGETMGKPLVCHT